MAKKKLKGVAKKKTFGKVSKKASTAGRGKRGKVGSRKDRKKELQLEPGNWIQAALEEIITSGFDNLRINSLADRLKVTKGSFYWHFEHKDQLLEALLRDWEKRSATRFVELFDALEGEPWERIETWLRAATEARPLLVDQVYREWARFDENARAAMQRIDKRRLDVLGHLFQSLGYEKEEAHFRASIVYGWALSQVHFLTDQFETDDERRLQKAMKVIRTLSLDSEGGAGVSG